jgi:tetratricopeptide (TPR) repeat protein
VIKGDFSVITTRSGIFPCRAMANEIKSRFLGAIIMKSILMFFIATIMMTMLSLSAFTQTVQIELEVPEGLLHTGDYPAVRGTFSSNRAIPLSPFSGNIWTGTINVNQESFEYEYIIVRNDGSVEPEGYDGRRYTMSARGPQTEADRSRQSIVINDYLRGFGPTIDRDIEIEIRLDLSDLHGPGHRIQQVGIAGSWGDLSWVFPGQLHLMHHIDDGVWVATISFPHGTPLDIPIKFAWQVDDIWDWEYLPHYHIHLMLLDPVARMFFASYAYDTEINRVVPLQDDSMQASMGLEPDAYKEATERYKGSRNYHYHLALDLLHKGDLAGANEAYALYERYFPEEAGTNRDHYFTEKIQYLGMNGQQEQALKIVESRYIIETDPLKQASYRYLTGWVLLNANRFEESRQAMRESMELAGDGDLYHSQEQYARYGLAMGYIRDPDPGEQENAREHLLTLVNTHINTHIRRTGWEQLARISKDDEDKVLYEQAMEGLQKTGSVAQRARSRIKWVEYLMDYGRADSTLVIVEELEQQTLDAELMSEVQLLKAEYLLRHDRQQEAGAVLEAIETNRENTTAREKARHRLEELERSTDR